MSNKPSKQRFRVIDKIAVDGMAEVFRAETAGTEGFKKKVTIKRVLPHLSRNQRFMSMFLDEARLNVHLRHSNVVQVLDIGKGDDTYYIVMEYVDGADLKAVIETQRKREQEFPLEPAVYIATRICQGLAYAHDLTDCKGEPLGIVHREMSPPNVLITRHGEIKITDFGLAVANNQLERSEPGIIKGKFSYLAPETAMGHEVDARADIFAVGIILWEMIAGRRLFIGNSDYETVKLVQQANIPSLSEINHAVPPGLERIILKSLARDLNQRYSHALELAADLNAFLYHHGQPVGPWDISRLVKEALDERERQKPASANIIGQLIKQALFEFTSLGTPQDQSGASPGGRSTPTGTPSPLDPSGAGDWESEILINNPYGPGKSPTNDNRVLSSLQDIQVGNLSSLEDMPSPDERTRSHAPDARHPAPPRPGTHAPDARHPAPPRPGTPSQPSRTGPSRKSTSRLRKIWRKWTQSARRLTGSKPPPPDSPSAGKHSPTRPLYWNTGFPNDQAVNATGVVFVGTDYRMSTSIDPEPCFERPVPVSVRSLGFAGPRDVVPIQFAVRVSGPAEVVGEDGISGSYWESSQLSYSLAQGSTVACFTLRVLAAGTATLAVTLRAKGRSALERQIALRCLDLAENLAKAPRAPHTVSSVTHIGGDLTSAPEVDMSLDVRREDTDLMVRFRIQNRRYGRGVPSASTSAALLKAALDARRELVGLSRQYRTKPSYVDGVQLENGDDVTRAFARIGRGLHRNVFGRGDGSQDLAQIGSVIARAGSKDAPAQLSIDAELLPLPWALLYDRDVPSDGPVDIEGFWGCRFLVDMVAAVYFQGIPRTRLPIREEDVPIKLCINPNIDSEENIAVLDSQRRFFARLLPSLTFGTPAESRDEFEAYLRSGSIPNILLYFFCHGEAAKTVNEDLFLVPTQPSDAAFLKLDAKTSKKHITVDWMQRVRDEPLYPGEPFVFLNACSTAQGDEAFQSLFVTHFLQTWRASGLLGTEWKVPAVFADFFGRSVLESFLIDRKSIGESVHRAVVHGLDRQNPFGLIYAIYGTGQTRIT